MNTESHSLLSDHKSLQRYLPASLIEAPENDKSNPAWAESCTSHLEALLHAVSTYLPRYLVNEQLLQGVPGQTSGQFRQATIMFADISGFTALSERLSSRGQQGADCQNYESSHLGLSPLPASLGTGPPPSWSRRTSRRMEVCDACVTEQ